MKEIRVKIRKADGGKKNKYNAKFEGEMKRFSMGNSPKKDLLKDLGEAMEDLE